MIKAIIFDCFGVLVGRGYWTVYEQLGGDVVKDHDYIDEWLDKVNSGAIDNEEFSLVMAKKLGIDVEEYKEAFKRDELPNQDVFDFINEHLKGRYKLALITNATGEAIRRKIPESKLKLFDELFISEELGLLKPDPRLFDLALDTLHVEPEDAIFIDDHQAYIDGAKAVGVNTILFKSIEDLDSLKTNPEL